MSSCCLWYQLLLYIYKVCDGGPVKELKIYMYKEKWENLQQLNYCHLLLITEMINTQSAISASSNRPSWSLTEGWTLLVSRVIC